MNAIHPIQILLVEDNPLDLDLSLRALRKFKLGDGLHVARDGVEALDFLFCRGPHAERKIEDAPRVVLLDIKLPKLDGLEVLRAIKTDPRTQVIPVVMMTSSQESTDVQTSYQLGANSFIVKPLNASNFTHAMQEVGQYWLTMNHPRRPEP